MDERSQQGARRTPVSFTFLARRTLRRLAMAVIAALVGFAILIVSWILLAPRI